MPVKMSKADPKNAERAAEHFAVKVLGCVKTVRAIQTQFQRQDMFGSDVIGKLADGTCRYIQVTTGGKSAVQQRKQKMLLYPWQKSDKVYVIQMQKFKEKKVYYKFEVNELRQGFWEKWITRAEVDKSWFKALKKL